MFTKKNVFSLLVSLALTLTFLLSSAAQAGSTVLTLSRTSLTNVNDAAGTWQYEGGKIQSGSTLVGYYSIDRRITTAGTSTLNTAAETITLFLATTNSGTPPRNITIQGAHSFTSGGFIGSVSAASGQYHWVIGADVSATSSTVAGTPVTTLTIGWLQSPTLTLP